MNIIPVGTDEIVLDSGQTIGTITSQSVTSYTFPSGSLSYVVGTGFTSDINYQTSDVIYSVIEGSTVQFSPDLPCSITGLTSVSFSIGNYITPAPPWISINTSTGLLIAIAPEVSSDTEFDFYISSAITGVSGPVQKLVQLKVIN